MRMPSLFALSLAAATVIGSGAAFAGPTISTIPLPSYSDGFLNITFSDHENTPTKVLKALNPNQCLAGSPACTLSGTGVVTSITGGVNTTYNNGSTVTQTGHDGILGAGNVLTDVFTGFTLRKAVTVGVGPTASTTLFYTGGTINLYVGPNQLVPNTTGPSIAQSLLNAGQTHADGSSPTAGFTLFLALTPEVQDVWNDTFITVITGPMSNFTLSQGVAYLSATGGSAMGYFDTNSVTNSYLNQVADLQWGNRAGVRNTPGDFKAGGADDMFNVYAVPEPITLSLFGAGLAGAAAIRRRKAKKA